MIHVNLRIREWDEAEFLLSRDVHTELLGRSSADPLFQSWDWLSLWWTHFGKPTAACRLRVLAAEAGGRLIGLLPVVDNRKSRHRLLRMTSANVLGNFFRLSVGIPTEYQDVIAEVGQESAVLNACVQHLKRHGSSDELSVGWCENSTRWKDAFALVEHRPWEYVRRVDPVTAYSADLSRGFEHYAQHLSGNSRRALVNLRRKLHDIGSVTLHAVCDAGMEASLSRLNDLHARRWGSPAFNETRMQFHQALIARIAPSGAVAFSELRINDLPVSVLYDLRAGNRQYNIQMGFDPDALRSGSLGLLHLGYGMEAAAAAGIQRYDFLGGTGKNTDYKTRIATHSVKLETVQLLRAPLAALLFRLNDARRRD